MSILERLETEVEIKQAELPFAFCVVGKQHFSEKLKFQWGKKSLKYLCCSREKDSGGSHQQYTNKLEIPENQASIPQKGYTAQTAAPLPSPSGASL